MITTDPSPEQATERALQRLNEAQRIGQIGDWEWRPASEQITWSPQVFEIFGRDPALGPPSSYAEYLAFFDEENRTVLSSSVAAAIATGEPQAHAISLLREDGSRLELRSIIVPRKDADGRIQDLHGTIQDVTASRRIEAALSGSELRFRNLFEHMLEGYAYCRALFEAGRMVDFVCLEVNEAFEKLTGLRGVAGRRISELVPNARARSPAVFQMYENAVLTGVPERGEVYAEILGAWLSLSVYSPDREHFVVVFDNITERKRSEEALRASEQEFRELAEAMPQVVWITRPDGWVTYFSRQWMEYTGLSLEESLGHGWITPFHPDDRQQAWVAWQAATSITGSYSREVRLRRADGAYRWCRFAACRCGTPAGWC